MEQKGTYRFGNHVYDRSSTQQHCGDGPGEGMEVIFVGEYCLSKGIVFSSGEKRESKRMKGTLILFDHAGLALLDEML